jgi:hypothetical protein
MTDQPENELNQFGGKIGARLAKLVSDSAIYSKSKMSPHNRAVALSVLDDFTNLMSDESKEAIGGVIGLLAEAPELGPEIKQLVDFIAHKRGQWQMFVAGSATGAAMGSGLIALITNELNPAISRLIAGNPNGNLAVGDAARAQARNLPGPPTWEEEARRTGIDNNRFNALVEMNKAHASPVELQELRNRSLVTIEDAYAIMQKHGYDHKEADMILALRHYVLAPADLSAMWNRSIVTDDEGERLAAKSGVSPLDWARIKELGGEPPSPQALAEGFRRGFINEATYQRGIVQGPIRNEWFGLLRKLSYARMSTVDAADAVNQGHMSATAGRAVAEANGIEPEDFEVLLETAGQPPGIQLAQEAWLRGIISESEFDEMFLESRIKNRYLKVLKATTFNLIPQETMRLMYRHGVYTREDTLTGLQQHGYTATDAAAMVALEEVRQTDTTRELTVAQVRQLYTDRAITLEAATTMLLALGYSDDNARFILELGDLARIQRYVTTAISRVHASFVAGRINETAASAALDRLGITADQRDDLLVLWDLEHDTVSKGLTVAQITSSVKKSLLTIEQALARLVGQGYGAEDALILLQLAGAAPINP